MSTFQCCKRDLSQERSQSDGKPRIPPPAYMLIFAGLMWLSDSLIPLAHWFTEPWNLGGIGIVMLSFIPASGAFRLFSQSNTTANPFSPEQTSTLVTNGVYRFSRNPMYLSLLFLLTGWAIYLGSLIILLFPPLFVWVINTQQIRHEELALEKLFGEEYLVYKRKVRRWL